jgi:uncharacterized membrane protein
MNSTTIGPPLTTDLQAEKMRIPSIDIVRGFVMVIMALDHTRDFFHADAFLFDPTNLEKTNPLLFFTRIITHFCAPAFVLLSGTAIRITQHRKSKKELSIFLLTRGLWLILLEVTVVRFSFFFQLYYDTTVFQVIWAIGMSMVVLSALIHLPFRIIVTIGVLIVAGHDLLHTIELKDEHNFIIPWTFIHQVNGIQLFPGKFAFVAYPFLPWLGIMLLGYGLGEWYSNRYTTETRKRNLFRTGLIAIMIFIVIRYFNLYGDPAPWSVQKNILYSFMSFLNVTKYPPSLMYTLMTVGLVLIVLSLLENMHTRSKVLEPLVVFGRVPLFYYILHFFLIHFTALCCYMITSGKNFYDLNFHSNAGFGGLSPGAGYSLGITYLAWITIVLLLYPVCFWYNRYKSSHRHWWLSYL